jgi:hypothetical protein
MPEINCDSCPKEKCTSRVDGALCSLNRDIQSLIVICETRDSKLMAMKMAEIMGTEMTRYQKAIKTESIGECIETTFINPNGKEITVIKVAGVDSKITQLAHSLIKNGKIINDILNPPKVTPLFQQNNQYNFGSPSARVIDSLRGDEKEEAIKFLDERLNGVESGC